ncbi:hypothetical protein [Nocardia colli]
MTEAAADLDNMSEEHYKGSTLIMQQLRDMTLWRDTPAEDEPEDWAAPGG